MAQIRSLPVTLFATVQTSNGRTVNNLFRQLGTTTDIASNANASINNFFKKSPPTKIFIATAYCTHLPLPANAQTQPKAKSKECKHPPTKDYGETDNL